MLNLKQISENDLDLILEKIASFWQLFIPFGTRMLIYNRYINRLKNTNKLYFCTKSNLLELNKKQANTFETNYGIRMHQTKNKNLYFYIDDIISTLTILKLEKGYK